MDRRKFLQRSGLAVSTAIIAPMVLAKTKKNSFSIKPSDTWAQVRSDFNLDHSHIQMAQMLLASHPKPVRDAIEKHRKAFNDNPTIYWEEKSEDNELAVTKAAAKYMNVDPSEIALTDSTTQGLAILYNGFKLKPGDEVVQTTHDHYVTDMSLVFACQKSGATLKRIQEFENPSKVTVDEVVSNISKAITSKTKIVAVTWVQSCTGVKLPIRAIADRIEEINATRDVKDRIYFCVDGVHGFGNQDVDIASLGCDFFSAGTHKWIFGPRGTGLLWGRKSAWDMVRPTVPSFRLNPYLKWIDESFTGEQTFGDMMSPGGFHAFDHRYALNAAFEYQMALGRDKVHQRTTALNTKLKEGISQMSHVKLHTPIDPNLSAGINCFEVNGISELEVVKKFHEKGVIASSSPYKVSYARLTPCIINTEEEVDITLKKLAEMKA